MTVLEKAGEPHARSNHNAGLTVDPTDITFEDLTRDTVMIRVTIRNEGKSRSSPACVRLESAPFGAFVPWRPLASLPVPALNPGESRELSVTATRSHPVPLGDFNRVPPVSLLRALDASPDKQPPQPGRRFVALWVALWNLIRRRGTSTGHPTAAREAMLPPDLWEWFGREQQHWAGNINVFVGKRPVERHVAKALRIYSGRTNLAMFVVGGTGRRDAYSFDLVGLPSDWKAALHDVTAAKTLIVSSSDKPVQERQWVQAVGDMMVVMLVVRPPLICEDGKVQVHVTSRYSRKTAVVEFDMDPTAQGTGCYVA
ncbi:MAG TPA: hypothetical protein VMF08_08385 [Candidatus Sulfotelmatobacter sp.]|nr:hypothetical protein [Candidatus Sulfotelmatobacter sp.]